MGTNAGPVPAPCAVASCTRPGPLCVVLDDIMGPDASAGYMTANDKYASALVQSGFAALAANMQQMEGSTVAAIDAAGSFPMSTQHQWQQVTAKARAASNAADMTAAARLKALQKTPFPMVIARMKVLLERLNQLVHDCRPATASAMAHGRHSTRQSVTSLSDGYASSSLMSSAKPQVNGHKTPTSGTRTPNSVNIPGSKGTKAMFSNSGGVVDSITLQLSMQAVLQELEVIFGFVSEFLAKVPQETRLALAKVARMENYKTDQVIYDIGQQADNFYIILSGRIDIWSHPPGCPRPKTTVSVLRKGDTFGDQAIINKARHSTAASPGCNASLLVVSKEDFLTVFGPYFQGVAASWTDFLLSSVSPFKAAQLFEVQQLCSAMVSSKPPPNKEFDLQQDQVFLIKEGAFELQLIDLVAQKAADLAVASAVAATSAIAATVTTPTCSRSNSTSSTAADAPAGSTSEREMLEKATAAAGFSLATGFEGDLPVLGTHGVLASVQVIDGRALGTLGYERELRRQRHASVPRKTVAVLGPGSWFGGGGAIYGSGPIQSALRVVAKGTGPFELIHLPLEGIEEHGGEALIRRLRDDAAFTCTYYLGRLGLLRGGTALGHPHASLLSASSAATDFAVSALATTAPSAGMVSTAGAVWCRRKSMSMPGTPKQAAVAAAVMGIHAPHGTAAAQCSAAQSYSSAAVEGAVWQDPLLAFNPGHAAAPMSQDLNAAAALLNSSTLRRTGRQRQKYVHVAGSGVYSPGTMAALQLVHSLQAEFAANKKPPLARAAQQQELQSASGCAAVQAGPSSAGTVQTAGSRSNGPGGDKSSSRPGSSIGPSRKSSIRGGAHNGAACTSTSAADGCGDCGVDGAVTAAERYWAQPGHSSSATTAALNPLLSSLFTDGLQPLVQELDFLMDHAQAKGRQVPCLDAFGATEAAAAAAATAGADSLDQQQRSSSASRMPCMRASGMAKARGNSRPCSAGVGPPASWHWGGVDRTAVGQAPAGRQNSRPSTCAGIPDDVLQHRPYSSLLAATVMWQRSSDLSFRPPLRQCLTSAEIDQQQLDRALA